MDTHEETLQLLNEWCTGYIQESGADLLTEEQLKVQSIIL